jgi:hypothetical protein
VEANLVADLVGIVGGLLPVIPAVKLLSLQRQLSRLKKLAKAGKSDDVKRLANELHGDAKESFFEFSTTDAALVGLGLIALIVSGLIKLLW